LPPEKAKPIGRFTSKDRVRKRSEYQRIQSSRFRVITSSFIFLLERTAQAERPRVGITASRRVGNAVQRNRAKRLVREAFRVLRSLWPKEASIVVIVRAGVGDRSLDDVVSEWRAAQPRIERTWARVSEADSTGATDPLDGKNSC
jgi:ribonuclease P protein component